MSTLGIVLLVVFIIISVLLILLVSIQDDGENGMGLLGGRGTAAFGSHSANVLTKTTYVFVTLFFVLTFALALVNKKPRIEKDLIQTTGVEAASEADAAAVEWWNTTEETVEAAEDAE